MPNDPDAAPTQNVARLSERFALALCLALIAALYAVPFLAIPRSDWERPVVDEWAFVPMAWQFAHRAGLDYRHWASMPFLGQLIASAPLIWILGPTYAAARLTPILMALLGGVAFYDILRQSRATRSGAALATFVLLMNPEWYGNVQQYMTDAFTLSLCLSAIACYLRAAREQNTGWLLAGSGIALLAATTRQNAVAASLACLPLIWRGFAGKRRLPALVALVAPLLAAVGAHLWFSRRPDIMAMPMGWELSYLKRLMLAKLVLKMPLLIGAWALPVTLWAAPRRFAVRRPAGFWRGLAALLLFAAVAVWFSARDAILAAPVRYVGVAPEGHELTAWLIQFVAGAIGLIAAYCVLPRRVVQEYGAHPLVLFALINIVLLTLPPTLFTRYFLPILPGFLLLLVPKETDPPPVARRWARAVIAAGGAVASGLAWLSIAQTHDLFAKHAALWRLGERTLARGVPTDALEGSWTWNAAHGAWNGPPSGPTPPRPPGALIVQAGACPFLAPRYGLSYLIFPGTEAIDSEPYTLWLGGGTGRVFLIQNAKGQ